MFTQTPFTRRTLLREGALAGGAMLAAATPFTRALAQGAGPDWPHVAALVQRHVAEQKVAGMVATLGFGQDAAHTIAGGNRAFTGTGPVDADSLFRIYSMTKPITGIATMMCIEDGVLGLDWPLAEVLPAFANMQVQRQADGAITPDNLEPAARPITIRQLLTHTAGLGYSIVQQGPISAAYRANGIAPFQFSRLPLPANLAGTPARDLATFADNLATLPLVHQPGTRWSYAVGLDVLGRVIEVVSGMAFDAFLQTRIFEPCGMDSTFFRVPRGEAGRLTANYFLLGGMLLPIDLPESSVYLDQPAFPFGGSGLVSSPRDYDRFLQMLAGLGTINGRRVMDAECVRIAASDLLPDTLAPDGGFASGGRAFGYGAGGLVGRGDAAGLFGWFGAAGTAGLVNLDTGLRHNLMTQYMPAESYDLQSAFPLAAAQDAAAMGRGA